MNLPDVYEFAVRPEQTWIIGENGPNIIRIYTDGRQHPPAEDLWPTYSGDSVGHWEGDTLVFDTISTQGLAHRQRRDPRRTGLILSEKLHTVTRMRKIDENNDRSADDARGREGADEPWMVTKRYRKAPAGTRAYDYACAENNRNPTTDSGQHADAGTGRQTDR